MKHNMEKQVIVTGAARGIGKAIAEQFAVKGFHVWLIDILEKEGLHLEKDLKTRGLSCTHVTIDVSKLEDIQSLFHKIELENITLDVIINNAGVSSFHPLDEITIEDWDMIMNTNVRSAFLFSKLGARFLKKGSSIINIASTRANMSEPGSEAYAASKGAIVSLTHALAASLSDMEIRVNAISPGWIQNDKYQQLRTIDHEQHWSKRVGKPEDIARACFFLSSPDNDFITGENLVIDGGMTRKMIYNH
ncbi:SDR family oxidoreductase [Salipaludibacillus daqingensis]|uniref:SDR family oxidoreductase n=1 Tax=Salipaludibacillus daqingensis TaxID=3041001 RepID=UPI002474BB91|nr:SDR family oxidoreductase [Salipaludibacillus daqingensis]